MTPLSGAVSAYRLPPGEEECVRLRVPQSYFRNLLVESKATPIANSSLLVEFRESNEPASGDNVGAIMQTLRQVIACHNLGDFAAVATMFTDRYWIAEMEGNPVKADEFSALAAAPPMPPDELMEQRSRFSDARILPDGRIAGFLRWDYTVVENVQLVAFGLVEDIWRIDEVLFVEETAVFSSPLAKGGIQGHLGFPLIASLPYITRQARVRGTLRVYQIPT